MFTFDPNRITMKNIISSAVILTALLLASCAKDSKDDPTAPSPSTDNRDKYVAYWNASENSTLVTGNTFTVNIIKSTTSSNDIIINNFSGLSESVRASVSNTLLTIPYQQVGSIGFAQGTGTLTSANAISLNYTATISTNTDTYTATYTK